MTATHPMQLDLPVRSERSGVRLAIGRTIAEQGAGSLTRVALLLVAGAMPVSAIPVFVLGWLTMTQAALFIVAPMAVVAVALLAHRSAEARWAARGAVAGLVAVAAYDVVRLPEVATKVWPDFIPRIGGWVTHSQHVNTTVGYVWRYLGDGAGIGMSWFVFCGLVFAIRPALVTARPVLASIAYGVFVWSGLIATIAFTGRGAELLFKLTPTTISLSLLGHLVYGAVLGVFLRSYARRQVAAKQHAV